MDAEMKQTKIRLAVCAALTVAILGFILGNSMLPAAESGTLSGGLRDLLGQIFPALFTENGEHILRKLAHFAEFAALGGCLCWLFKMLRKPMVAAVACGVAVAVIDECIQLFSLGRSFLISDMVLDSAGVTVGTLLLLLCNAIVNGKTRC